ncbi:MAG: hypothetical protein COV44_04280 [Deltaproteobacteria bacterium CG11_big_fil_rev_8_21_14_0_20_45_16]|nr:MAG: hypothetical protein COV44_04280 [Deltaproteobacteria bacterium CG11_big_fil_rev_8_21_14_0_20_45_16]
MNRSEKAIILGSGYTGKFLKPQLEAAGFVVKESNRSGSKDFDFSFEDPTSWGNIPKDTSISFALFAAESPEAAQKFASKILPQFKKFLIVSTARLFKTTHADEIVTESSALDTNSLRFQSEEILRNSGAIVIHAAGIYGPGRSPVSWLKRGLIKDTNKILNLIHVEDLCGFLVAAALKALPGSRFIASDSKSYRWEEIMTHLKALGIELPSIPSSTEKPTLSKQIRSQRSREQLGVKLSYPDLFTALKDSSFFA